MASRRSFFRRTSGQVTAAATTKAEQGTVNPSAVARQQLAAGRTRLMGAVTDDFELTREIKWPQSNDVWRRMQRWGQIAAITGPHRRDVVSRRWNFDQANATPEHTAWVAEQFGLPVGDTQVPQRTGSGGFSWHDHVRLVLDAPFGYGHYSFEVLTAPNADATRSELAGVAPRPPWTITGYPGDEHGNLIEVRQRGAKFGAGAAIIPAADVLHYIWDGEPGSFLGVPLLRPLYGLFLCAERVHRIAVVQQQRNAVGMPAAVPNEGTNPGPAETAEALAVMETLQSAETGAIVPPAGFKPMLLGVSGATVNPSELMRYYDEVMARVLSMQVVQLGSSATGSRALGDTFEDKAAAFADSICEWIARQTQPLIDRLIKENFGDGAASPVLAFPAANADPSFEELTGLVNSKLLDITPDLKAYVARRVGVAYTPELEPETSPEPVPSAPGVGEPVVAVGTTARVAATTKPQVGHRAPNANEILAAVDYDAVAASHDSATAKVVAALKAAQAAAVDDIVGQLTKTSAATGEEPGMLARISSLTAPTLDLSAVLKLMVAQVKAGANQVAGEASSQGVTLPDADLADAEAAVTARAGLLGTLMGNAMLQAAQEKASIMPAAPASEVAAAVRDHLEGLSDAYVEKKAVGVVTASNGAGRDAQAQAGRDAGHQVRAYASELLDSNTCSPCAGVDGTEYDTAEAADEDYPGGGGYKDCEGGERCRGMQVFVWDSEQEAVR